MACSSCRQTRCVCEDRAVLGVPVTVVDPTGDLIANSIPCESTACTSTPSDPSECSNAFRTRDGNGGDSFLFSSGGPFQLNPIEPCLGAYDCPPDPFNLTALPDPTFPGFVAPGSLADVICANLSPGTFKFDATFMLQCANPATRVVVLYRPNCDDDSVEFAITDCHVPCAPIVVGPTPTIQGQTSLQCTGFLAVPNLNCRPGFRILTQTGCAQCPDEINEDGNTCVPNISNVQLMLTRLSGNQLININETGAGSAGNNGINVFLFTASDTPTDCTPV